MIGAIENAMIARVRAATGMGAGKLGYAIATIDSYGGQLDDTIAQGQPNYPAVWFALVRDDFQADQGGVDIWQARWMVLCATRSLRNEQARRHGAAGEVGAYQLVQDLRRLMSGQTLGLAIDPIQPQRIEAVHNGGLRNQPVAVYALELSTAYSMAIPDDDGAATPDPLVFVHTDWAGPLPADADADLIQLEQEEP